jgi:hypothetical protein
LFVLLACPERTKFCLAVLSGIGRAKQTCMFEILTKWFSVTRLETRTKESNIYASIWVENPNAQ